MPQVKKHLVPEARVEQVEHGVLRAADIQIDRHPVALLGRIDQCLVVRGVEEAQVVPARPRPLRHGVGLAPRGLGIPRVGGLHPVGEPRQRRLGVLPRALGLETIGLGQAHRQHLLGERDRGAFHPHDRERLAPVALAREQPVAQLVVDRLAPLAGGLEPGGDLLDRRGRREAVDREAAVGRGRVHHRAVLVVDEGLLLDVSPRDHLADREVEGARELPVPAVVPGDRHDRPRAVAHQHVVGDPDRYALAVHRIDCVAPGEDPGLLLHLLLPLQVALARGGGAVGLDRGALTLARHHLHQRVLGCEHHVGGAEQRVRASGEDPDRALDAGEREIHLGPDRAADPVLLHLERAVRPVDQLQVLEQPIGVSRDLEHPLAHRPADDGEVADLALAVDDLLVGQHGAEPGAPVDGHLGHVGEPALEELEEDPLRPPVVFRIGGVDLALPVIGQAEALHLAAEGGDVLGRGLGRVHAGAHGVLLGRQTEGVPSHGVKHVEPAHPLVARQDVGRGVALGVPDMEAFPGWIGEHVEAVELGLARLLGGVEQPTLLPEALPAWLDLRERITLHRRFPCEGPRGNNGRG